MNWICRCAANQYRATLLERDSPRTSRKLIQNLYRLFYRRSICKQKEEEKKISEEKASQDEKYQREGGGTFGDYYIKQREREKDKSDEK